MRQRLYLVILIILSLEATALEQTTPLLFSERIERANTENNQLDIDAIRKTALVEARRPILSRAYTLDDMENTKEHMRFIDNRQKYRGSIHALGPENALAYSLATSDVTASSEIFWKLPLIAALLHYESSDNKVLQDYLKLQLTEICRWQPLQRQGWSLSSTSTTTPLDKYRDGVWLATGNTLQALVTTLELLPPNSIDSQLIDKVRQLIATEIKATYKDWIDKTPWYVRANKFNSNQWIVPAAGMLVGSAYLGTDKYKDEYNIAIEALTDSFQEAANDGSLSEGYAYAASWTASALLLSSYYDKAYGENRLAEYDFINNFSTWMSLYFQPGGNFVNAFDNAIGQRNNLNHNLYLAHKIAALSSDPCLSELANNNETQETKSGFFKLLNMSAKCTKLDKLLHYGVFQKSNMFIWRSSWDKEASGVWVRGGDKNDFHDHFDRGHVNFISRGTPILIEAGTPSYNNPEKNSYFDQPTAHNVIEVSGKKTNKSEATITLGVITSKKGSISVELDKSYPNLKLWNRSTAWNIDEISIIDKIITADETPEKIKFYWHIASPNKPETSSSPKSSHSIAIDPNKFSFPRDAFHTKKIEVKITTNSPVYLSFKDMKDHTLKNGLENNLHTVLIIETESAVNSLELKIEFTVKHENDKKIQPDLNKD